MEFMLTGAHKWWHMKLAGDLEIDLMVLLFLQIETL